MQEFIANIKKVLLLAITMTNIRIVTDMTIIGGVVQVGVWDVGFTVTLVWIGDNIVDGGIGHGNGDVSHAVPNIK